MTNKTDLLDEFEEIARQERDTMEYTSWPDCWKISTRIHDALLNKSPVLTVSDIDIVEYKINGTYTHYAIKITTQTANEQVTAIIDGSFDQFAIETDTPINICKQSEINPITVVTPAESYVFHQDRTQI